MHCAIVLGRSHLVCCTRNMSHNGTGIRQQYNKHSYWVWIRLAFVMRWSRIDAWVSITMVSYNPFLSIDDSEAIPVSSNVFSGTVVGT